MTVRCMIRRARVASILVGLASLLALAGPASGQVPPPDETRYQKVLLDGPLAQPMRVAVAPDGRVIFIERAGAVKVWSPQTERTTVAGIIPTALVGESGLIGLALAPNFAATGHLYLNYAREDYRTSFIARVSRFTLGADNTLDVSSERTIIDVQHPIGYAFGHDAGDLLMTPGGELFIATGDNTHCCLSRGFPGLDERPGREQGDAQRTSSNTNSLIGKILRITPRADSAGTPGIGTTYDIPAGNLYPEDQDTNNRTLPEYLRDGLPQSVSDG